MRDIAFGLACGIASWALLASVVHAGEVTIGKRTHPSCRLIYRNDAAPHTFILGQFQHVREHAMAVRTKTYPIVENAINLFSDWLKHRQEMSEIREMNSGDFARIAQDLCISPAQSSARDRTPAMNCFDY